MEGVVMKRDFWKGRRVLLTGHTGFKGSWLSLWLQLAGAELTGYSLDPPTSPSLFEAAGVSEGMTSLHGDVRDLAALQTAVSRHRPEIVIHMAAQPLVRHSYREPVETYATNVMGTVNLLEAVRRCRGVRVLLVVTTDKCYENRESLWGYREHDPLGGYDPYSSSKGCAELVTAAYRKSFFQPASPEDRVAVATARAGNVIGGGDWAADRLIPDIMRSIMAGTAVAIRNPEAIRPWQHVLEPLNGYLTLAERLWQEGETFGGAWNFGPDEADAKPVWWVTKRLTGCWGDGARSRLDPSPHPHETACLKLDCSKARALLGWSPRLDLPTALEWVVEWFRTYRAGGGVKEMTFGQIERYETLVPEPAGTAALPVETGVPAPMVTLPEAALPPLAEMEAG
jgi:CDP-glucose 4,6-dehydratase